ncbi:ABC transporter substrate-binding protein [Frankia sp. AgB1.9]|uniref:ABC transporter substrate-binding protein n=1 Tax=unclassified Frankia TaxID=2632575 RepID=UPI0019326D11|nr:MULTISPECIES: ABC transporter substrate-binding protein [unclassified Frankia]MBL7487555.1 ABC transporter substrate-binding protein [Frankia sp. AgW1.1]MBL7549527.1 ABC transporter substrate-binding protein [Frankia sp. AgB1.9]MBL7620684.1 ABC transporter substrate-binding protein [Frankia sp. AgB1.8]
MSATTAALALAAVAAGCSSSAANGANSCVSPGVTAKQVKVGLLYPDTGLVSNGLLSVRAGVTARIGLANASGGVRGRQIMLVPEDDHSDPEANLSAARHLVEKDGVFGIVEETAVASGSASYLDQQGIPVTGLAVEPVWAERPNMFTDVLPFNGPAVTTFGLFGKQQGATRAFVLQDTSLATSQRVTSSFAASFASQGIALVGNADYSTNTYSADTIAKQIIAARADAIIGGVSASSLAQILVAARQRGAQIKLTLALSGYDQRLVQQYGSQVAGMSVLLTYAPFESNSPALGAYRTAMAAYAPELVQPDDTVALTGYVTADLFLRGLEAAGPCPTRAAFIQALRAVTDYRGTGLLPGPVDLRKEAGGSQTCYYFVQVNRSGTGFDAVRQNDGPGDGQWCGKELPATG